MTIDTPLWLQEGAYPARVDRGLFAAILTEGAWPDELLVTERGAGANMSVDVSVGRGLVDGDDQANQGSYLVSVIATENVAIAAADLLDPRIDLVVLKVRDSNAAGGTDDDAIIEVVTGTPDASPVAPALPDSALLLAEVLVPAAAASIVNADISDASATAMIRPELLEQIFGYVTITDPRFGGEVGGYWTDAIQAALDTGKRVFIPEGVWPIEAGSIAWPSPNTTTFQPSPWLVGAGYLRTILRVDGTGIALDVSAPTLSGTGAFTSGTNSGVVIEGMKIEGRPGQTAIFANRYFNITMRDVWLDRVAGELYAFDFGIATERTFVQGPPREDDINTALRLDHVFFLRCSTAVDTARSSANALEEYAHVYVQGVGDTELATIQATYPGFLNDGLKLCGNHITGLETTIISCRRGLWLARGADVASIDRISTAVTLISWHFEGMEEADIYVEACRGLTALGCEAIDHNAIAASWVPTTILVPDGATNDVGNIIWLGGFLAPSQDVTYGPNWRGVYAGTNFSNSGASYILIDTPVVTAIIAGGAVNESTASRATFVIQRQGPKVEVNGTSTRGWSVRIVGDSTARLSGRPNGVAFGPGGVTTEDTIVGRSGEGILFIVNNAGTVSGIVQAGQDTTTANLEAIGNAVNTIGKFRGKMVWNQTTSKPCWAAQSVAGGVWLNADGTTAHTPV